MVTEEEVALVQSSWEKVAPIADTAADLFSMVRLSRCAILTTSG